MVTAGASNVDRGKRAERAVVTWLRGHGWPDARRYLAGDGRQPGDIDWHPVVCLEAKDRTGSAWPTWCRQAVAEARPGMVPAVVRRTRGARDVGGWQCRVPLDRWVLTLGQGAGAGTGVVKVAGHGLWVAMPFREFAAAVWALDHAPDVTSWPR